MQVVCDRLWNQRQIQQLEVRMELSELQFLMDRCEGLKYFLGNVRWPIRKREKNFWSETGSLHSKEYSSMRFSPPILGGFQVRKWLDWLSWQKVVPGRCDRKTKWGQDSYGYGRTCIDVVDEEVWVGMGRRWSHEWVDQLGGKRGPLGPWPKWCWRRDMRIAVWEHCGFF